MAISDNNGMQTQPTILFGGSFDPVHNAHIQLAEYLVDEFNTFVRLMPCYQSPTKRHSATLCEHRLAMLHLASKHNPRLMIDTRELASETTTYTVNTLRELRRELGEEKPIIFVVGLDSLLSLNKWKEWEQLLDLCHLYTFHRPGNSFNDSSLINEYYQEHKADTYSELSKTPNGLIYYNPELNLPMSSTATRKAIAGNQNIESNTLAPVVMDYIQEHNLYSTF